MNKRIITLFLLFSCGLLYSQNNNTLKEARNYVASQQFDHAVNTYSYLVTKNVDGKFRYRYANNTLLLEYAYALALNGVYDGALMCLDQAILIGRNDDMNFYIAQVLSLMDYGDLAKLFWQKNDSEIPSWISLVYNSFIDRYKRQPVINQDEFSEAFKRANSLAANEAYIQSIILFQEIIDNYPQLHLPYIGYSAIWEKLGMNSKAIELLQKGISLMDKEKDKDKEAISTYEKHLKELINSKSKNNTVMFPKSTIPNQWMVYFGGMYTPSFTNFNTRFGVYTRKAFNFSFDFGVSYFYEGSTSLSIGTSFYKTWKVFVLGLGMNHMVGLGDYDDYSLRLSPTFGFTIMGKRGKSSFDLMFNAQLPVLDIEKFTVGVTIGQSFYFGKIKKRK